MNWLRRYTATHILDLWNVLVNWDIYRVYEVITVKKKNIASAY